MTTIIATGKTISGNYIGAPMRSGKFIDYPSKQRAAVIVNGEQYDRAIFNRAIWRNNHDYTIVARFVIVNGIKYEVVEVEDGYTVVEGAVYNTFRHVAGVEGKHAVPHVVVRDWRGWYYAVISHDGKIEYRKVSHKCIVRA